MTPKARTTPESPQGYEEKHVELLQAAAALFAERGFHDASVRELSRATGRSLSGLYYYFHTKEELLYQIQHHCYTTLLATVRTALEHSPDPRQRLLTFIDYHLTFFRHNMNEMKVLAHEDLTLTGEYGEKIRAVKREYSQLLVDIVASLDESARDPRSPNPELAAFILFGAMNWLYTWPRRVRDIPSGDLVASVARIFLFGYLGRPGSELAERSDSPGTPSREFWKHGVPRSTGTYGKDGS